MKMGNDINLKTFVSDHRKRIDKALNSFLPKSTVRPKTLHKSMRYSLFAGGKRLRPVLCLAASEDCGGDFANAIPAACAVECIHDCYLCIMLVMVALVMLQSLCDRYDAGVKMEMDGGEAGSFWRASKKSKSFSL